MDTNEPDMTLLDDASKKRRQRALALYEAARVEHAETTLSPWGIFIRLKKDVTLIGRPSAPTLPAGLEFIDSETGELGLPHMEKETLENALAASEKKTMPDGEEYTFIGKSVIGDVITVKPVEIDGKPLFSDEIYACLALEDAKTEEDRQALYEVFPKYVQPPLPSIRIRPIRYTDLTFDKVNDNIWRMLDGANHNQLGFSPLEVEPDIFANDFNVARSGSGDEILVTYCIDFSALEASIERRLSPFDKRVCNAVAAVFNAGYKWMSLQQIYEAMGFESKIGTTYRTKINDSLTKLSGSRITLSNADEVDSGYNRVKVKLDGMVISMLRATFEVNGQTTEGIYVLHEPLPVTFAKSRGQFTTINIKLLRTPNNKHESTLMIEDYLLERIAHMKNKRRNTSNKIMLETLYKYACLTTTKQKDSALKKIKKALAYYVECEHIKGFSLEADCIVIDLGQ